MNLTKAANLLDNAGNQYRKRLKKGKQYITDYHKAALFIREYQKTAPSINAYNQAIKLLRQSNILWFDLKKQNKQLKLLTYSGWTLFALSCLLTFFL